MKLTTQVRKIVSAEYFHGEIEKDKAEARLNKKEKGTFLLRLSTTFPEYPFTLSMINQQHKRIKKKEENGVTTFSIALDGKIIKSFGSVSELIAGVTDDLHLIIPCPQNDEDNPYGFY